VNITESRGERIVVVAHRPSAVAAVDHILVLNEGRVQAFGPRDAILQQPQAPAASVGGPQVVRAGRKR